MHETKTNLNHDFGDGRTEEKTETFNLQSDWSAALFLSDEQTNTFYLFVFVRLMKRSDTYNEHSEHIVICRATIINALLQNEWKTVRFLPTALVCMCIRGVLMHRAHK